jgi:hypothetical protein
MNLQYYGESYSDVATSSDPISHFLSPIPQTLPLSVSRTISGFAGAKISTYFSMYRSTYPRQLSYFWVLHNIQ